ncbi:pilus assembly protein TadG-related protein [Sinomonas humi]|uniref:Pilus assembly protein TadG n=1 Tax=Sinomonas humi TaxID=1338436 RepID=A0A0B2ASV7_9MICC|nr:pilus assembly protein TadG-related protein [Sinomonas humi]KHL05050.1 pilus assembly protein TadG [Sinomonas humi]
MRRLISKFGSQYDAGADCERGAVAVVTALLLVVLLAVGALAVDGGMLYGKRAQLQSGADAAALAVGQKCAASLTDPQCTSTSTLATSLAQSNMLAGQAGIASLTVDTTGQTVTAVTQPLQPGMQPGSVSLFLAQTLGITSASLGATATVAWGSPSKGIAPFPLAFSVCQVQGMINGDYQLLESHGSGANPNCNYGPSGQVVPGGFGWLVQDSGQCGATINIATSEGGSDPGNNPPQNCNTILQNWVNTLQAGQRVVVLLPVFTGVTGTGSGSIYTLSGFAAYNVIGWNFGSNSPSAYNYTSPNGSSALSCSGNCRGIIGQFITYVDLNSVYQLGPSTSFGATVVNLTN